MVRCLDQVAQWDYLTTPVDFEFLVKVSLDSIGRMEPRFTSNRPADEFVQAFIKRNMLTLHKAIKYVFESTDCPYPSLFELTSATSPT